MSLSNLIQLINTYLVIVTIIKFCGYIGENKAMREDV